MHRIELGDRAKIKGLFGSKRNATESRMIAGSCERAPILEDWICVGMTAASEPKATVVECQRVGQVFRCARNRPGRRLRWLSRQPCPVDSEPPSRTGQDGLSRE
jgi:hypothetical protein